MSEIIEVSGDWLALREREDARARSQILARQASSLLPDGPLSIHDLGSGTGSMLRWLAPLLPGPQLWTLHDWNAALPESALHRGLPLDAVGRTVQFQTSIGELSGLTPTALQGANLITASALLDVLTRDEIAAVVRACVGVGAPALFSLSVTGEVVVQPPDERDRSYATAFNAHQRRTVRGRELLGPDAATVATELFAAAGWQVQHARTLWTLDAHSPGLLAGWLDGWIGAAEEQEPMLHDPAASYRLLRERQRRMGELSAVIVHTDLLACPA